MYVFVLFYEGHASILKEPASSRETLRIYVLIGIVSKQFDSQMFTPLEFCCTDIFLCFNFFSSLCPYKVKS